MKNVRKAICLILVLILTISSFSVSASGAVTATTVRLEKTEGTVKVTDQNKVSKSISKGMTLRSGYTVTTKAASYSWESLDKTKAMKTDANTSISIRKSGSRSEILVNSGKVYFNVSKKLGSSEKMNIRTSTMVAGVRGTIGVVEKVSAEESILYLLEGVMQLKSTDHNTGVTSTVTVTAGQKAVVKRYDAAKVSNTRVVEVTVDTLDEEEIPLFARAEVKKSTSVQKRIEATETLSVPKIIGYDEALFDAEKQAQKDAEAAKKKISGDTIKKTASMIRGIPVPVPVPDNPPEDEPSGSYNYYMLNGTAYEAKQISEGYGTFWMFSTETGKYVVPEYNLEDVTFNQEKNREEMEVTGASYPVLTGYSGSTAFEYYTGPSGNYVVRNDGLFYRHDLSANGTDYYRYIYGDELKMISPDGVLTGEECVDDTGTFSGNSIDVEFYETSPGNGYAWAWRDVYTVNNNQFGTAAVFKISRGNDGKLHISN